MEMSNEIVPFSSTASHHSNAIGGCRQDGSRQLQDIPQFNKLNLLRPLDNMFTIIGDNHHMANLFPPINGHSYVSQSNPNLTSVGDILDKVKGPSILWLRGCDSFLQHHPFPFKKFLTLTALEISSIDHLNNLPKEISEMRQLQSLNLSHLPIQHFPTDDFFSKLTNLRSLILTGCSHLVSLAKFPDRFNLTRLILKGCTKLQSLSSIKPLKKLQVLDVSHCTSLQDLHLEHCRLSVLDLSYTVLHCIIEHRSTGYLNHVHCRGANGSVVDTLTNASRVEVLDLSGAQNLKKTIQFKELSFITALDLSRTDIESIDFLSPVHHLQILSLRECRSLVKLPSVKNSACISLKVLDVLSCESLCEIPGDLCELLDLEELNFSGCTSLREFREGFFDQTTSLQKLDLSNTSFNHLPSFSNLNDLGTHLILSRNLVEIVPDLPNLTNLNLEIVEVTSYGSDEIGGISNTIISNKPNELHIVSTFARTNSPFNEFKNNFTKVKDLIIEIDWSIEDTNLDFERIYSDLEYILVKIDLFESFEEEKGNRWKLMRDLMFAVKNIKADDFINDSRKLKKLFNLVVKLKLLVPPCLKKDSKMDIKDPKLTWQHEEKKNAEGGIDRNRKQQIRRFYESLTEAQRNCLLYFAARVPNKYPMVNNEYNRISNSGIKERNLIQLWHGEGFIAQPQQQTNASELGLAEETGRRILKVLRRRGFIQRLPSRRWSMEDTIHRFVRGQVKEESFFDVDNDPTINWLTPQLSGCSQRACLLKSQSNLPSSCELWLNYTKKVECFKNIQTLFNVNECIIDIRPEWFSKMTNLTVLHLGRWDDKNEGSIEVVDMNFLKELKKMKKLRVLSFEGVAGISKLPDSICKLTDLRILNLKECSDLKELPSCIGTLTNLAHLNLTHCPLFTMLPMEIKLLSKLEVLKGFVMTYDDDGVQDKKACTLADLLKLHMLRKLSLVVNIDSFPNSEHLQIFKEMKNLCSLQITWLKNNYIYRRRQIPIGPKALKPSRWQQFKCWEQRTPQNDETDGQIMRSICALENLKKLVLCCFPSETAPKWLHPSELHNLEKLYIRGGHLKTLLPADTDQNISWNVKALHLDHTLKLDIDWESLMQIFPNLTFLKKKPKGHLSTFPVDNISGLWLVETVEEEEEDDAEDEEDEEDEEDDEDEEDEEEDDDDEEEEEKDDEEDGEEDNEEEVEEDDEEDEEEAYVDLC